MLRERAEPGAGRGPEHELVAVSPFGQQPALVEWGLAPLVLGKGLLIWISCFRLQIQPFVLTGPLLPREPPL